MSNSEKPNKQTPVSEKLPASSDNKNMNLNAYKAGYRQGAKGCSI